MYQEEIKQLKHYETEYFKKYFLNKDINIAMSERIEAALKTLLAAQTQFLFIYEIICIIKKDRRFWKTLDKRTKNNIRTNIKGVNMICNKLESILKPIAEGLNS